LTKGGGFEEKGEALRKGRRTYRKHRSCNKIERNQGGKANARLDERVKFTVEDGLKCFAEQSLLKRGSNGRGG